MPEPQGMHLWDYVLEPGDTPSQTIYNTIGKYLPILPALQPDPYNPLTGAMMIPGSGLLSQARIPEPVKAIGAALGRVGKGWLDNPTKNFNELGTILNNLASSYVPPVDEGPYAAPWPEPEPPTWLDYLMEGEEY